MVIISKVNGRGKRLCRCLGQHKHAGIEPGPWIASSIHSFSRRTEVGINKFRLKYPEVKRDRTRPGEIHQQRRHGRRKWLGSEGTFSVVRQLDQKSREPRVNGHETRADLNVVGYQNMAERVREWTGVGRAELRCTAVPVREDMTSPVSSRADVQYFRNTIRVGQEERLRDDWPGRGGTAVD